MRAIRNRRLFEKRTVQVHYVIPRKGWFVATATIACVTFASGEGPTLSAAVAAMHLVWREYVTKQVPGLTNPEN